MVYVVTRRRRSPVGDLAITVVALGLLVNEAVRDGSGRYILVGAALAMLGVIPANRADEIRRRLTQRDPDDG